MLELYHLTEDGTAGPFIHIGGRLVVSAVGEFGGGTLTVHVDHGAGYTTELTWTSDASAILDAVAGSSIKFSLSGATTPDLAVCGRS